MDKVKPCECGNENLIVWEPCETGDRIEQLTSIEKIECSKCGHVVYGSGDDAIDDWNNQRYDD